MYEREAGKKKARERKRQRKSSPSVHVTGVGLKQGPILQPQNCGFASSSI